MLLRQIILNPDVYISALAASLQIDGRKIAQTCIRQTSYVLQQIFQCDSLDYAQIRAKCDHSLVNNKENLL